MPTHHLFRATYERNGNIRRCTISAQSREAALTALKAWGYNLTLDNLQEISSQEIDRGQIPDCGQLTLPGI
jgi:hypothetical protein